MALPTTGSISSAQIRTEFGQSGPVITSSYRRGAGIVPNHTANANIPTANTNIARSNFYGAELAFTCNVTESVFSSGFVAYVGFLEPSQLGSVSRSGIGIGRSANQGTLVGFYNVTSFSFIGEFIATDDVFTISGGDYRGSWWSTIQYRGDTVNRTSAVQPNGTFDSGSNTTTWQFSGINFSFTGSGTHPFILNIV